METRDKPNLGDYSISITGLCKRYNKIQVLSELNLKIKSGTFTLLLGANGSGKSTLLRICAGLARPNSGTITFDALKPGVIPFDQLGYLGHDLFLYSHLSVEENLRMAFDLINPSGNVDSCLANWGLEDHRHQLVGELSRGLRAKTALMRVLSRSPKYLLLDEPTSFLDDAALSRLIENIQNTRNHNGGGCVFIATHDVSRIREFADRVVLLQNGSIVMDTLKDNADVITYYSRHNR